MKRALGGLPLLLLQAPSAFAHAADAAATPVAALWSIDPWSALLTIAAALAYARGRRRVGRPVFSGAHEVWMFWSGMLMLMIALGPPLDPFGGYLFSAHMVQHELLMLVCAPLLAMSRPAGFLLWGLPAVLRRGFARLNRLPPVRGLGVSLASPQVAWLLHLVVLWTWHLPGLFDASVEHDGVHVLQHATFFVSALLFWWALLIPRNRTRSAGAVIFLFTTALHSGTLGALLTFSPTPWYAVYGASTEVFGLSPLEDQQLGGLIMWVPSGLVFVAAGLVAAARCLRDEGVKLRGAEEADG